MRLYARQRRTLEALRVYDRLEQALRHDFSVDPSPEARELRDQLRTAPPPSAPRASPSHTVPAQPATPRGPSRPDTLPVTGSTLIGRDADMDAVRSSDPDPVEFRSEVPGVRHICGHDVHTTIGLALAEGFAAVRAELPGSLVLVFQPAEETGEGARAMLEDGGLGEPKPAAIYAVHTAPLEVGEIATAERSAPVRGVGTQHVQDALGDRAVAAHGRVE